MTPPPREWIDAYFDDMLTENQQAALSNWLKSDPEHARIFAHASLLHDRLRNSLAAVSDSSEVNGLTISKISQGWSGISFFSTPMWKTVASVAVLVAGLAMLWFSFGTSTAAAAIRELDRIIVNSIRSKDRTYAIVVEDITTTEHRGKRIARQEKQRPPKPSLDGATLHVRSGNQFVLIRKTDEGLPFITGSNGKQSWAINTKGPVRVSSDIHHFDHDLPGHETSVPLTDLHEGLEQLKHAYHLQFSTPGPEEYEVQNGETARLLVAVKKPKVRGPQRVEIAYDSNTGRILRMRFVQMPYGPDGLDLRLSLVNENELPPNFFEYTSHHSPGRKIEMEN